MARNRNLDVLRGVAVLLVLVSHFGTFTPGWIGVDLFFVLSGFLISGLLFSEWQRSGRLDIRRFYIRRAFKIWPVFFLYIAASELLDVHSGNPHPRELLSQIFFVQNYFPQPYHWLHLWSLAVEEHFYLVLPVLLYALSFSRFRKLPACFLAVAATCLTLRFLTGWRLTGHEFEIYYWPTHLRIDSLFFGVLLGWMRAFHPDEFARIARSRHLFIPMALAAAMSILFSLVSPVIHTIGFTVLYLGFGSLLMWTLDRRSPAILRPVAWVGKHSYSVYVWHLVFLAGIPRSLSYLPLYLALSIGLGVAMSYLIEFPALALRERMFPSRAKLAKGSRRIEEGGSLAVDGLPLLIGVEASGEARL